MDYSCFSLDCHGLCLKSWRDAILGDYSVFTLRMVAILAYQSMLSKRCSRYFWAFLRPCCILCFLLSRQLEVFNLFLALKYDISADLNLSRFRIIGLVKMSDCEICGISCLRSQFLRYLLRPALRWNWAASCDFRSLHLNHQSTSATDFRKKSLIHRWHLFELWISTVATE